MDHFYVVTVIFAMGLVTFALRALPFIAAQWLQKHPMIERLGQSLPLAIMSLLLIHSVIGSSSEHDAGPWFELIAITLVVLLQWFSKNPLLSILAGTALYVLLRNLGVH
ncbi:branched-chain amino acid transporter permease [Sheuella amnicola]|nr:AzlD domain-containing protein [Sheuella amnicola]